MQIREDEVKYIVTRRNLLTGELRFLRGIKSCGRDKDNILRLSSISFNNELNCNWCSTKDWASDVLNGILRYCAEPNCTYKVMSIQTIHEVTEI